MAKIQIIAHGSVNTPMRFSKGCREACKAGYRILSKGGTALDAVTEAVVRLENDKTYNAGTGSYMKINGVIEMDAAVMSSDMKCGAVTCIQDVKNPVLVARKVMENTPYVMLSGSGATEFARKCGFRHYDPLTPKAKAKFAQAKRRIKGLDPEKTPAYIRNLKLDWLVKNYQEYIHDTVGAVARDRHGDFAAAGSTGGTPIMLQGRVGDTPIIGAGLYAGPKGAVVATGVGEMIMRQVLSKGVYDAIAQGTDVEKACKLKMAEMHKSQPVGIVALSEHGYAVARNRPAMVYTVL